MNVGNLVRQSQPAASGPEVAARIDAPAPPASKAPAGGATATTDPGSTQEAAASRQAAQQQLSRTSVEDLVRQIAAHIRIDSRSLSFTVDDELGETNVKVIDLDTEEVIRQIPSEEMVRIAAVIRELTAQNSAESAGTTGTGLLIQEQA